MDAFAPASVTAVFTPIGDGDASRGVSVALADGVEVSVDPVPGNETRVTLEGEPTAIAPVAGVLDRMGVDARVDVRLDVPIGAGFGTSGGATLATALAANAEFDLGWSRTECLHAAHDAEVTAGTGLGDVFVQEMGGLVYDLGDGRKRTDVDATVAYESYGDIPTAEILADEAALELVREQGTRTLGTFTDPPSLSRVVEASWGFALATGLASERVEEAVDRVEAEGGVATMAMIGETVVGVAREDGADPPAVLAHRSDISNRGAHVR